jgi:menaquinone-dependent protoporphyrinogen oxidase
MRPIGVLYVTRHGQTEEIARHIAYRLSDLGADVEVLDLDPHAESLNLHDYRAVVLAAPVYRERHRREMTEFVKRHLSELQSMPSGFVSVSMSQAGAERPDASAEEHANAVAEVQKLLNQFSEETGWRPEYVQPVAGALMYTKYNVLLRFLMRLISKKHHGSTDTSRDHEYTNWLELDRFVAGFYATQNMMVC